MYLIYFPAYKKAPQLQIHSRRFKFLPAPSEEWKVSVLIAHVVAAHLMICVLVTIYMLVWVGGPENSWTSAWASFLGITSVILATIQYVPQIMRTFRRKVNGLRYGSP